MEGMKHLFLLVVGGTLYTAIEHLFRGHSHWTMFFIGGFCFILVGLINEVISWDTLIWIQMLYGALLITAVEFVSGFILNLCLHLNVWDYSNMPLNILGQICLPFSIAWYFLSIVAIVLDDYLRYWFFGEEKPHYHWR